MNRYKDNTKSAGNRVFRDVFFAIIFSVLFFNTAATYAQFNLAGSAAENGVGCYVVTPAQGYQTGAVWNTTMIDLNQPFDITLVLNFGNNDHGADGMSFVLQPLSSGLSADGSGVGYGNISPSLGVVMDTYENVAWDENHYDPWYDHMSLHKNGDVVHGTSNELVPYQDVVGFPTDVENGQDYIFRFQWTPGSPQGTIRVWFNNVLSFTYHGDIINDIFNGDPHVYWGMSGSTGGANNLQSFCMSIVADFISTPACAGQEASFQDVSVSSTDIVSYTWDFGDGTVLGPGNHPNVTHIYEEAGEYTVNLTIENSAGLTSTNTATITIGGVNVSASVSMDEICLGSSTQLHATVSSSPDILDQTISFSNNNVMPVIANGVTSGWTGSGGNFITSNIPVSGISNNWSIESICLNIDHNYTSDLIVYLKTPCGDLIRLIRNSGGSGSNFHNTCFSPLASQNISAASAPFSGTYIPEQGSSVWDLVSSCGGANGTWSLLVGDTYNYNIGQLNHWSISFRNSAPVSFTYEWQPLGVSNTLHPNVSPEETTQYVIYVENDMGCTDSDTVQVMVSSSMFPVFEDYPSFCIDSDIPELHTTSENDIVGTWSPAINNQETTTYTFTPEPGQCASPVTMEIVVDAVIYPMIFTPDTSVCLAGGDIQLLVDNADGYWSGNGIVDAENGIFSPAASGKGSFDLTYHLSAECAGTAQIEITVDDVPELMIFGDSIRYYCQGQSIVLSGSSSANYMWSNGHSTSNINVSQPGVYELSANNYCGTTKAEVLVIENELPVVWIGNDTTLCIGNGLELSVDGDFDSYYWSTGETTSSIIARHQDHFKVTVTTAEGCEGEAKIYVRDSCDAYFYIPTAFSPDKDGLNDVFKAYGVGVEEFHMEVYDRWGKLIFVSNHIDEGWDGRDENGRYYPHGVYAVRVNYSAWLNSNTLQHKSYVGSFVLLK